MCNGIAQGFAPRPATAGRRRLGGRLYAVVLLVLSVRAVPAAQWVYDDYLTLALNGGRHGDATRVRADALLPREVVEAWTDDSMAAKTPAGARNPAFGLSRGYRVRIVVTRDGAPVAVRPSGGVGPLADRVGVFTTRVGAHQVWMRSGYLRVEFTHPAGAPPATYTVTWYVDCRPARTETLRLPEGEAPRSEAQEVGLAAEEGRGIYPPGTTPGVPYPFRQEAPPEGWPAQGAGLLVASLSPEEAQGYLGLPQRPKAPVLVGWQPDGADCLAWFYGREDADIALRPPPADVQTVAEGQVLAAGTGPQAFRLADAESGLVAAVALAPGAVARRVAAAALALERGALRVSVHDGALGVEVGAARLSVSGLALIDAARAGARAWCLTRELTVGDVHLRSGQMATIAASGAVPEQFDLSRMRETFLSTCLVAADADKPREASADEVTRASGVITDVILCEGLDNGQRPVNPGTAFPAGIGAVSVLVGYRTPSRSRARVSVLLLHEGQTRARSSTEVTGSGKFVAAFRPQGAASYTRGLWQIQVHVDDRLEREIDFAVGMQQGRHTAIDVQ